MYHKEIRLISSCLWPLLYLVQKDKETDKIAKTKKEDIVAYIPLKAPLTAKEAIQAVLWIDEGTGTQPTANLLLESLRRLFTNGSVFDQSDAKEFQFRLNQVIKRMDRIAYFKRR
jgi:FKBP-type peptidyl-prolyl cis-trans isomerase